MGKRKGEANLANKKTWGEGRIVSPAQGNLLGKGRQEVLQGGFYGYAGVRLRETGLLAGERGGGQEHQNGTSWRKR